MPLMPLAGGEIQLAIWPGSVFHRVPQHRLAKPARELFGEGLSCAQALTGRDHDRGEAGEGSWILHTKAAR